MNTYLDVEDFLTGAYVRRLGVAALESRIGLLEIRKRRDWQEMSREERADLVTSLRMYQQTLAYQRAEVDADAVVLAQLTDAQRCLCDSRFASPHQPQSFRALAKVLDLDESTIRYRYRRLQAILAQVLDAMPQNSRVIPALAAEYAASLLVSYR